MHKLADPYGWHFKDLTRVTIYLFLNLIIGTEEGTCPSSWELFYTHWSKKAEDWGVELFIFLIDEGKIAIVALEWQRDHLLSLFCMHIVTHFFM